MIADIYSFLGNPKGTFGTLLCLQSVVCYTFADGAGVKICCSPYLSNIFSQTAKLQRGGRLPYDWQTVRPAVICEVGKRCIPFWKLTPLIYVIIFHKLIYDFALVEEPIIQCNISELSFLYILFHFKRNGFEIIKSS